MFLLGVLLPPSLLLITAAGGSLLLSLGAGFLLSVLAPWVDSLQPPLTRFLLTLGILLFWAMAVPMFLMTLGLSA